MVNHKCIVCSLSVTPYLIMGIIMPFQQLQKLIIHPMELTSQRVLQEGFPNGRNLVDFIAELLGFENYIQRFATATGSTGLQGVNYASGAAGIRRESGYTTVQS
ncbi:GDSL esterase/lipase [Quillaja saponaria]|uniref:GDSL esterase/lipase n=1 Tax=Quillaja saponaria TaxID=32244 RepID=A0AAD7PI01_QUISA|nr:GDSL esterase/lipase [Quillaja saponaria]